MLTTISRHIAMKLGVAFAILVAILAAGGWLGLSRMSQMNDGTNEILDHNWSKVQIVNQALTYSNLNNRILMQVFFPADREEINTLLICRAENSDKISALIKELEARIESDKEKELLNALKSARAPYVESYKQNIHMLLEENKPEKAREGMVRVTLPLLLKYHAAWSEFVHFEGEEMDRHAQASKLTYAATRKLVFLLSVLAVVFATGIAGFVTRSLMVEISLREQAEQETLKLNRELEQKVTDRTAALARSTHALEDEIGERKRAEQVLCRSEEKFRRLVDNLPGVTWTADQYGRTPYISRNVESVFGYTAEEICERGEELWIGRIHPNDMYRVVEAYRVLFAANQPLNVEYQVQRKDGKWIWVHVHALRTHEMDGVLYADGMLFDITARKRAEESLKLFRMLIDQSNDAIQVVDPETLRILDVNETACLDLGYTREELLSLGVPDIAAGFSLAKVNDGLQKSGSALIECWHRRKDGSTYPVEVGMKQVLLDRTYVVTSGRDITERKTTEQKLHLSEARLALKNRLVNIFLTVSDDQMFGKVLEIVLQSVNSECGLFGYIDEQGVLVVPSLQGQIWQECKMQGKSLRFPREVWGGTWGKALIEKALLCSNRPGHVPDGHVPILRSLVMPVLHQSELIGLLAVANKPIDYDEADKELLERIAEYLAPVLHARLLVLTT